MGTSTRSSTEQAVKGGNSEERANKERYVGRGGEQLVIPKSEVVAIKLRGRDKAIRPR